MLNSWINSALKNRGWVLGLALVLAAVGGLLIPEIPIDAVPDITNVQVVINTKTEALDPERIETRVTKPIEIEMTGLPHLEEIRSISKYGLSQVTLIFKDGTDIYWARQQVSERLGSLRKELLEDLSPELAPITTGLGEVFMYSVEAEPGSALEKEDEVKRLTQLRLIHDYQIRPILKRIVGVADIDTNGGYQKEIHINFFPKKLEKVGLSVEQLTTRLKTLGENFGGGYIQRGGDQIIVRTVPGFENLNDLNALPLGLDIRGRPIRLNEVADVRVDHSLRVGAATRNGMETVLGTVLMRVGANSRQVASAAENALKELKLPAGVRVVPLYTRSYLVNATIHTVSKNLLEGAFLVILVLVLLLGNFRAAALVALAIPFAMLVAVQGMWLSGISANLMSLGAIDFGLLVDGSVVLIENIIRRLEERAHGKKKVSREEKRQWILEASQEVIRPITFGLVMVMFVYLPVLSLEGVEKKMFSPMAITVLLALFGSLLVAVFVMPVLADLALPIVTTGHKDTRFFAFCKKLYLPLLKMSFNHRRNLVLGALILMVISGVVLSQMGSDFVPKLNEGDLVLNLARNSKQGIDASVISQKKAEDIIKKHPEVERVFSRIGTAESATDPMGVYLADTFVILKKDGNDWKEENKEALAQRLKTELSKENSDQDISATQPIEMRFNEMLEGSRADVTLRVIGSDLSKLMDIIEQSKKEIEGIHGVSSVESDPLTALKKSEVLDLEINHLALSRYGVNLSDLNQTVELAMGGKQVGSYFEGTIPFPIRIHLDESLRNNIDAIKHIPILLPEGGTIPLSSLTNFSINEKVTTIAHIWSERYAAISIDISGRDVSSVVNEAKNRIEKSVQLPEGYQFYWGGQFKNLSRAQAKLAIIVPITLLIVFAILLRNFGSLSQTLLVFSSVPFAAVGGVFALFVRDIPLSVSAAVGFIALIGIALLNSIVLVTVFHQLQQESPAMPLREVVEEGALLRLRPVLMTALVASLGFIPMAFNQGLGAEVQRPLATVVIGGLMTSTLLTLLLLPTLYLGLGQKSK